MRRTQNNRLRARSADAGFTLIETLIATALMVAILAALATVTAQWLPNWNRGFARVQRTELLSLGLDRVISDLAAAEYVPAHFATRHPMFEGRELAVTFVRTAIGPNSRPGLEIVRIAEAADGRGLALVRARAPFVPMDPNAKLNPSSFTNPVVLLRAPFRISFSYAGADKAWRATWLDANELPSAVQVTVRNAATGQILSASTAALVHVTASAECARAKATRDCVNPASDAPDDEGAKPGGQKTL